LDLIRSLPLRTKAGPNVSPDEFYQAFNQELVAIILKFFPKVEEKGTLPNSFYKARISQDISVNEKGTTRKKISLMNIKVKVLNKTPATKLKTIEKNHSP
jgi:hypothetical protein